jgi:hypothetical protein
MKRRKERETPSKTSHPITSHHHFSSPPNPQRKRRIRIKTPKFIETLPP